MTEFIILQKKKVKKMSRTEKNLKIYSIVFIIFAVCGTLMSLISLFTEELNVKSIAEQAQTDERTALIVIVLVVGIALESSLAFLFLGIQGLRQLKGKYNGGSHILIAQICSAIEVIIVVMDMYCVMNGSTGFHICLPHLIDLCFLIPYTKYAKSIRKR